MSTANKNIFENGVLTLRQGIKSIGSNSYSGRNEITKVVIPDGVISIGSGSFALCQSLSEVVIPTSVTEIGGDAFNQCVSLQKIILPEGLLKIGQQAFYRCESLTEINIPSSVVKIGVKAFMKCSNLKHITISEDLEDIGRMAFSDCEGLADENGLIIINNVSYNYISTPLPPIESYDMQGITDGSIVVHKMYGEGIATIDRAQRKIIVKFSIGEKMFSLNAFERGYLSRKE